MTARRMYVTVMPKTDAQGSFINDDTQGGGGGVQQSVTDTRA